MLSFIKFISIYGMLANQIHIYIKIILYKKIRNIITVYPIFPDVFYD